jgi:hypothetical protein
MAGWTTPPGPAFPRFIQFAQANPSKGEPVSGRTEVRGASDSDAISVGAPLFGAHPVSIHTPPGIPVWRRNRTGRITGMDVDPLSMRAGDLDLSCDVRGLFRFRLHNIIPIETKLRLNP